MSVDNIGLFLVGIVPGVPNDLHGEALDILGRLTDHLQINLYKTDQKSLCYPGILISPDAEVLFPHLFVMLPDDEEGLNLELPPSSAAPLMIRCKRRGDEGCSMLLPSRQFLQFQIFELLFLNSAFGAVEVETLVRVEGKITQVVEWTCPISWKKYTKNNDVIADAGKNRV